MEVKKTRLKTKSVEKMKELSDIIKNSETDEIALGFLKESWEDDFPDLDLGREDLHSASEVLIVENESPKRNKSTEIEDDLNKEFKYFFKKKEDKKKRRRRRKR